MFFSSYFSKHFKVSNGKKKQLTIENKYLSALFDADSGLLTDLKVGGTNHKMQIRFMKYGTVWMGNEEDGSGAYLFLPDGEAVVSVFYRLKLLFSSHSLLSSSSLPSSSG